MVGQWFLLFRDIGTLRRHLGVEFLESCPFRRKIIFVENRFDRAFGNTCFTIDALIGMDVQNLVTFIETLDRAHHYTIGILAPETRLSNYVCHRFIIS
jgi:hypothetical protein